MATNISICSRRLHLSVALLLASLGSSAAWAQTAVTAGSPVPTTHGTWGQIMKVQVARNGSVVFLDWSTSGLYQLRPGSSSFNTIASGSPLENSGTFWNSGLTMDAKDTIYIADRYGSTPFFRIPYNPVTGTWDFTGANAWGGTIGGGSVSLNTYDVAFIDSAAADGSGKLVVATETSPQIWTVPVDNKGVWGTPTILVKGLKARATHVTADINGNVYFLEDEGNPAASRVTGIFFIPAGMSGISGSGDGTAEAQLQRLDSGNMAQFSGISLDTAGNIYVTSQADSNGGAFNGDLMIPNISGSPVGVTAASFNFNAATFLTPVQTSAPLAIDPRGYLWIPTGTGGWTPPGSLPYPGTMNVVLWQLGAASLPASPVGTAGTPGTVFYSFSSVVTPAGFTFSQPGMTSDFVASATNPLVDPTVTPAQLPCTAGKTYSAFTSCPYFIALNAHLPGAASGQVSMQDATGKTIPLSTAFITGIGQGPDVALLLPTSQSVIGGGLVTPQQVAADARSYSYVADPGLGKVLQFGPGAGAGAIGTSLGTGLSAPTGVAVDGAGDVFIADSGKVYKIPFVNGALNAAGQTTLQSGLGKNLKLAADGLGNVFVTDPDNARILKISNTLTTSVIPGIVSISSGFSQPSAIATDSLGNVYVADGNTLYEIIQTFDGAPIAITNSLKGPVTGLAVEPSGSIEVAQGGGLSRIPFTGGVFGANSAVAIDGGVLTAPKGLAMDTLGNLYVSDVTGGTPNLQLISINASVNFGQVSPFVPSTPTDVNVFNIGNAPLMIQAPPTFSGVNGAEFNSVDATQNGCDLTGMSTVPAGSFCIVDLTLTATTAVPPTRAGTMMLTSNAVNSPTVTAALTGIAVDNLERSKVTVAVTPTTTTFPGTAVATVTVAGTKTSTTPTGEVILTLINQNASLRQTTVLPAGNLVNGTVAFNLKAILGGTYTVQAVYHGDSNFSGGLVTTPLIVAQAPPTVTLTQPSSITPILGVYYVKFGTNTILTASVSSTLGSPTGNVSFLNGTTVADPKQNPVTLNANGSAIFNTVNLAPGTYVLTAVYNSDQNFSKVSSSTVTFQVIPPSLLITAAPATLSTTAGTPVSSLLTFSSLVGFEAYAKGGVFIACDNATLPKYSECTFDVPQPTILAGKTGTSTVTISTNLPVNVGSLERPVSSPVSYTFAGLFGLGALGLLFRRRATLHRAALTMLSLGLMLGSAMLGMTGCTNAGYTTTPPAPRVVTPSGTYQVRIYATDPASGAVTTLPFTLPLTIK